MHFSESEAAPGVSRILLLLACAVIIGLFTGFIGYAFLFSLRYGAELRIRILSAFEGTSPLVGLLMFSILTSLCAVLAAWMVRRFAPTAKGSGVPYVESIMRGNEMPRHAMVVPVKFVGGWLALSTGLVLGREGPMVQMGAVIGEKMGRINPWIRGYWRQLMGAGAGAGLAVAFNAPVGGTLFIMEEVMRKVTPLSFILTATSICSAICLLRGIFHETQDYFVPALPVLPASAVWLFVLFGLFVGLCGVLYNILIVRILLFSRNLRRVPGCYLAAIIGFVVGTVTWCLPKWMCGGDEVTQNVLLGAWDFRLFLLIAAVRFFLGPLSYAAGTPGGLFAPIVAMGVLLGALAGHLNHMVFPELAPSAVAFSVLGMAAFFTATVRAPVTGIVICLEMTGAYSLFFPMLATCLGAYLVPWLMGNLPIYDALAELPREDVKNQ